jgi:hypothetical protein
VGEVALCAHLLFDIADDWAAGNRIVCDLVHRGVVPLRLPKEQRDEPEADAA